MHTLINSTFSLHYTFFFLYYIINTTKNVYATRRHELLGKARTYPHTRLQCLYSEPANTAAFRSKAVPTGLQSLLRLHHQVQESASLQRVVRTHDVLSGLHLPTQTRSCRKRVMRFYRQYSSNRTSRRI